MPETDSVLFYKPNEQTEPQGSVDLQNLQEVSIYYEKKWLFIYCIFGRCVCWCVRKIKSYGKFLANIGILQRNLKDLLILLFSVVQMVTMTYSYLLFKLSLQPLNNFFLPKVECQSLFHRNTKSGRHMN